MLKKSLITALAILSQPLSAAQLLSFEDMEHSLNTGKLITIVYKYTQCELNNPDNLPIPIGTGVFRPQTYLIGDDGFIAAKGTWFTSKVPHIAANGLNQHFSFIINKKNQLQVTYEFYNADNGQKSPLQNITINCELGKGFRVYN
jgi:hypothetical protein